MSSDAPQKAALDGSGLRIAVLAARYNRELVDALAESVASELREAGARRPEVERVPGSAELPFAASLAAHGGGCDAVIALGVVIAGQTRHHRIIGESTAAAFQRIGIDAGVPVINGVIVTEDRSQAAARAGGSVDRGAEFARAALEMARLRERWKPKRQ